MEPSVIAPTPHCREFLGLARWCSSPSLRDGHFCELHATARRHYDEQTRRRTGAL